MLLCLAVLLRIGGGPFARRGPRVLVAGAVAAICLVILNYLGRSAEFDLAGTALLLSIVLLVTIRALGPLRGSSDVSDRSSDHPAGEPAAATGGTVAR